MFPGRLATKTRPRRFKNKKSLQKYSSATMLTFWILLALFVEEKEKMSLMLENTFF